jgi:hypothetical protein
MFLNTSTNAIIHMSSYHQLHYVLTWTLDHLKYETCEL